MGAGVVAMATGIVKTIIYGGISKNIDFFYQMAPIGVWM
jgi:hypothetical protein